MAAASWSVKCLGFTHHKALLSLRLPLRSAQDVAEHQCHDMGSRLPAVVLRRTVAAAHLVPPQRQEIPPRDAGCLRVGCDDLHSVPAHTPQLARCYSELDLEIVAGSTRKHTPFDVDQRYPHFLR